MGTRGIKALAVAASLTVLGMATQASADPTVFTLKDAHMVETYDAKVTGFGWAIANGVTFDVANYFNGDTTLYGFCIDIYHDMFVDTPLNLNYTTNQPLGGGLVPNSGQTLTNSGGANPLDPLNQISDITNLVETGFLLHQQRTTANGADTDARLAAIQVAIWDAESPGVVTDLSGGDTALFQSYVNYYTGGAWESLKGPDDKVFTITEGLPNVGGHQSFAIGWPIDVPEPTTWALMLAGFGGMGAMLRRQRKAAAATA